MKIAVVGATGRSGRVFIAEALRDGHTIRAGVRHDNNLPVHKNLTIVHADATEIDDIMYLIRGQDAVVSLIGHTKNSPPTVQEDAMKVLVAAMKKEGVTRLVSLTGTGVRLQGDTISFLDHVANVAVRLIDPIRILDGQRAATYLRSESFEWTLIRVLKLQGEHVHSVRMLVNGPTRLFVSRIDVARAILNVLTNKSFIRQSPIIGTWLTGGTLSSSMIARTHDLAAITALGVIVVTIPPSTMSLSTVIIAIIANLMGGIAPDIDQPTAPLWRNLPVGKYLGRLFDKLSGGHRFLTHSLIGVVLLGAIVYWLLEFFHPVMTGVNSQLVWWSFMIGLLSHLIMDTFTKEGVPWLLPIPIKFGIPPIKSLRITTDTWMEHWVIFPALLIFNGWFYFSHYDQLLHLMHHVIV